MRGKDTNPTVEPYVTHSNGGSRFAWVAKARWQGSSWDRRTRCRVALDFAN
jgi:hypothetical protein